MGFLWPLYLMSLALIPIIIAYHVFQPKSTEVIVSSVLLWQKALTSAGRRSVWDRLVRNLLLLIQILLVVVCAFLLSGFFINRFVLKPERYVMIIDTSASMAATDVDPDRLSVAKAAAVSYLRSLPVNSEIALFEFNSMTVSRLDYTTDRRSVEKAISELQVKNAASNSGSLVSLMAALAQDRSQAESVALFTDGNFSVQDDWLGLIDPGSLPVDIVTVGGEARNVAITALEIRRPPHGEGPSQVFAIIDNFSDERSVFPVSLFYGSQLVESRFIELEPHERKAVSYSLQVAPYAPVRLEIAPSDDLDLDNTAYTIAREHGSRNVLLITPGNINLYAALRSIPGLKVDARLPGQDHSAIHYGYDIVFYDETPFRSGLVTNTVVINAPHGIADVSVIGEYEYAEAIHVDKSHPLMRYVDERIIVAQTGQVLDPSPDAEVVAWGRYGPLVLAGTAYRNKYVYFGFPFTSRSFVGSPSFPILVYNLVSYMLGSSDDVRQLSPGDPIYVPLGSQSSESTAVAGRTVARITPPTGDTREVEVSGDFLLYADTYETGIYWVSVSGQEYTYAVNLFDSEESRINRRDGVDAIGSGIVRRSSRVDDMTASVSALAEELLVSQRVHFRAAFMILALLLLVVEWSLYHRRWHL